MIQKLISKMMPKAGSSYLVVTFIDDLMRTL